MELKIISMENSAVGTQKMPRQFMEAIRPDVISRVVFALQSSRRQPYGTSEEAGKRHSVKLSRRRHKYRGAYGHGISRVPRKIHTRRGTRMFWVGAQAPGTVGGRKAHPPKAEKDWTKKVNKKENMLAIRSAISATVNPELVKEHGYIAPENYPFVVEDAIENIEKTKDIKASLKKIGFEKELKRAEQKSIRAGKGKNRGRRYKKKTSLLFIVSKKCKLMKAAENIPGIIVSVVDSLNAEILAPGAQPGRLALFSKSAVERLEKEGLFAEGYKGKKAERKTKKKEEKKKIKNNVKANAKTEKKEKNLRTPASSLMLSKASTSKVID